ncbi:MAG: hypothetical protein MJZ23_04205 [Paludibacteraceae bacterium]|nr:hypothetical protein [Paludibacteraceae bacterium]
MLPLWIIDLNSDNQRCQLFQHYLRSITGAVLAISNIPEHSANDSETSSIQSDSLCADGQWYYTHFDDPFKNADFNDEEHVAALLYDFKESLVSEGQRFVELLRQTTFQTDININVCVLGHIEEQMTQLTFTSIAALIQLEKGRILPKHIHQGINIMGMLFIPSAVNTRKREERQKVLRCLREIEVQHAVSSVHGYDKMLLYQDVQNRTQKFYPQLNVDQQVDYITQCIVNLFYATNHFHPLLSGSSADDHFYLSLGPASIYYDTTLRDEEDRVAVANGIISSFKADGENNQIDHRPLVKENEYDTTKVLCKIFSNLSLRMDMAPREPDPHPVRDFLYKPLKRRYYMDYLARYPSMLMTKIGESVAEQTRKTLEEVSLQRKEQLRSFIDVIMPNAVKHELTDCNQNTGGVFRLERKLNELKAQLAKKQSKIEETIDFELWPSIFDKVPKELSDYFNDYHDEYKEDVTTMRNQRQTTADRCESRKREAINELVNHIKQEPTVLSQFARVFFLGLVLVLFIMPLLELVSPSYIDLGNIRRYAFFWATGIFLLPSLWQLGAHQLYIRKRNVFVTRLKAFFLHDAYARVVNAVQSEANFFYSKAQIICDEYLKRCENIRKDVKPFTVENGNWSPDIPKTMFNQPLVEGSFGGKHLFPGEYTDCSKVLVSQKSEFVNLLKSEDYYSLIRVLKDQMYLLFQNVNLPDYHERKVDEITGRNLFLSVKEMAELKEQRWQNAISTFKTNLADNIKRLMVPRKLATVDAKVLHYADSQNKPYILEPLLDFCSTNGELTSDNCIEYADIKCHDEKMRRLVDFKLPFNTLYQSDVENGLYKNYLFITKWRCFDTIAANRILPEIELDLSAEDITAEAALADADDCGCDKKGKNVPYSSLFLYALCGDDATASLWLKLFRNEEFAEISDKSRFMDKLKNESRIFNRTLNQLD